LAAGIAEKVLVAPWGWPAEPDRSLPVAGFSLRRIRVDGVWR
jgi:hypothetical protein